VKCGNYGAAREWAAPVFLIKGDLNMLQRMEAEILFDDQDAADAVGAVLAARGFAIEPLDWVDEDEGVVLSPTVWIRARILTELDASRFFDWVNNIVEPLGGFTLQAGLADPQRAA
jgi:hypothetical protein